MSRTINYVNNNEFIISKRYASLRHLYVTDFFFMINDICPLFNKHISKAIVFHVRYFTLTIGLRVVIKLQKVYCVVSAVYNARAL